MESWWSTRPGCSSAFFGAFSGDADGGIVIRVRHQASSLFWHFEECQVADPQNLAKVRPKFKSNKDGIGDLNL